MIVPFAFVRSSRDLVECKSNGMAKSITPNRQPIDIPDENLDLDLDPDLSVSGQAWRGNEKNAESV